MGDGDIDGVIEARRSKMQEAEKARQEKIDEADKEFRESIQAIMDRIVGKKVLISRADDRNDGGKMMYQTVVVEKAQVNDHPDFSYYVWEGEDFVQSGGIAIINDEIVIYVDDKIEIVVPIE